MVTPRSIAVIYDMCCARSDKLMLEKMCSTRVAPLVGDGAIGGTCHRLEQFPAYGIDCRYRNVQQRGVHQAVLQTWRSSSSTKCSVGLLSIVVMMSLSVEWNLRPLVKIADADPTLSGRGSFSSSGLLWLSSCHR